MPSVAGSSRTLEEVSGLEPLRTKSGRILALGRLSKLRSGRVEIGQPRCNETMMRYR